jgi:hypothetical protein
MAIGLYFELYNVEYKLKKVWKKIEEETDPKVREVLLEHEKDLFYSLMAFLHREKEILEIMVWLEEKKGVEDASAPYDDNLRERKNKIKSAEILRKRVEKCHSLLGKKEFGETFADTYKKLDYAV